MPFFRRRRFAPRRPAKKYGKKYGRRRFQKRLPARNNINQLTMKAPLASRMLRVKLPWVKTINDTVAFGSNVSYAFQGNAIVPYTVNGQTSTNIPGAGDSLPSGEVQYSQFYDRYFINGSSINIEAINITGSTSNLRAVLLAVPFVSSGGDTWQDNKTQLDAYTYEQLLAWPYAKWRMLAANTGGASRLVFKMFRKAKSMCGLKDLRDNLEYSGNLTDGSTLDTSAATANPSNGFMYYLRFFNNSAAGQASLDITVRMSLYCTMTNREFNPIQTITS